ncbi:hypothetical protein CCAL6883_06410 [Campylobacter sp. RM6883]|uniref:hypothetical protein n=1 Tax=Campylobacter californiensis TaxID=1032243 RepID=UPI003015716D|nr:hypothetical protein [Campylobacter sp. RM6883]
MAVVNFGLFGMVFNKFLVTNSFLFSLFFTAIFVVVYIAVIALVVSLTFLFCCFYRNFI